MTILISTTIVIYIISIFGAKQALIDAKQEVDEGTVALIFVPLINTLMTIVYLVMKTIELVKEDINNEINKNKNGKK
jgi:hypothetical protein